MADIFVSYKREDQEERGRVLPIVQKLKALGHDVFYDVEIPPGETWESVLQAKIDAARCVIVLWSNTSVLSDWVKEEASIAKAAGKFIPVQLDKVSPPLGFSRIEAADLSRWRGSDRDPEWANLIAAIDAKVSGKPVVAADLPGGRIRNREMWKPLAGLVAVAAVAAAGYSIWTQISNPQIEPTAHTPRETDFERMTAELQRMDEASAWNYVDATHTVPAYLAFKNAFPESTLISRVTIRICEIRPTGDCGEGLSSDAIDVDTIELPVEPLTPVAGVTSLASINAQRCGSSEAGLDGGIVQFGNWQSSSSRQLLTEYPGLVKLEPREERASGATSSGHCGATRVAEHWFVTAAHCVNHTYDEIRIVAGSDRLSSPSAAIINADAAICHSSYEGPGDKYQNDLALVRISDDSAPALAGYPIAHFGTTNRRLSASIFPVARIAGWGLTDFGGGLSDTLIGGAIDVKDVGLAAIRAQTRDGMNGPCVGDSGGPLYVDDDGAPTVVGVLSVVEQNPETGKFCEGEYTSRYTNLSGYRSWVETVISACNDNASLCG